MLGAGRKATHAWLWRVAEWQQGPVWCRRSGGLGPGCEEGSRCGEMEAGSWRSRALVQLPGGWGINGGPGRRPAHGNQISVLPSSVAPCPSSSHPDAVALKSGRAKVPLLCELRQVIHLSECQCSQFSDGQNTPQLQNGRNEDKMRAWERQLASTGTDDGPGPDLRAL